MYTRYTEGSLLYQNYTNIYTVNNNSNNATPTYNPVGEGGGVHYGGEWVIPKPAKTTTWYSSGTWIL